MQELKNGVATGTTGKGVHVLTYVMTAGTASLTYSVNGGKDYVTVPDSAQTTTTGLTVTLPTCQVKAVLTGDAKLYMNLAND